MLAYLEEVDLLAISLSLHTLKSTENLNVIINEEYIVFEDEEHPSVRLDLALERNLYNKVGKPIIAEIPKDRLLNVVDRFIDKECYTARLIINEFDPFTLNIECTVPLVVDIDEIGFI